MAIILSLDVGTGSLKAGLLDSHTSAWLARSSRPIITSHCGDRAEQDARSYLSLTLDMLDEWHSQRPRDLAQVRSIAVTGQMRSLVLVGEDHEPIGPVLTLHDRRAHRQAREFIDEFGVPSIHQMTGQRFDVASTPARIRWLSQKEPERLPRAWQLLAPKDYLRLRLTGLTATDPTDAAGWLLYDLNHRDWSETLARFAGVAAHQLPPIQPACAVAGRLVPELSQRWGMTDVLVAVGAGDDIAATGCGAIDPGEIYEHIGSTGSIFAVSDSIVLDETQTIECYPTEMQGRYWLGGSCNGEGAALERILALSSFSRMGKIDWEAVDIALTRWADESPSRRPLFLPYLAGERCPLWDPSLRGALVGLTMEHEPADVAIAAHEGVTFLLNWILQELHRVQAFSGPVYSAGKRGECEAFGRLRSTIYNRPIRRTDQPEATLFGAALIAGAAVGIWDTPVEGVRRCRKVSWEVSPWTEHTAAYQTRFHDFRAATRALSSATLA